MTTRTRAGAEVLSEIQAGMREAARVLEEQRKKLAALGRLGLRRVPGVVETGERIATTTTEDTDDLDTFEHCIVTTAASVADPQEKLSGVIAWLKQDGCMTRADWNRWKRERAARKRKRRAA